MYLMKNGNVHLYIVNSFWPCIGHKTLKLAYFCITNLLVWHSYIG